jgi:hypothetical protein
MHALLGPAPPVPGRARVRTCHGPARRPASTPIASALRRRSIRSPKTLREQCPPVVRALPAPERRERPAQSRRRRDVLVAYPRTYAAWLCKSACMSGLTPILHRLRRGGQTQWRGVTLLSCRPGPDRSRGTTDGLIALLRRRARVCAATVAARRIAHERERRLG